MCHGKDAMNAQILCQGHDCRGGGEGTSVHKASSSKILFKITLLPMPLDSVIIEKSLDELNNTGKKT
jgi:hypothetical protein